MAANPLFNPSSDSRLEIPKGINAGMYRVLGPKRTIPLAPVGDPLNTANSFNQVQCVHDSGKQICTDPGGVGVVSAGFSRVSLWLTRLIEPTKEDQGNIPLLAAGVQVPATPPPFDIQLRWACGNISETLFQGTVTPATWNDRGLIVQVAGLEADQIELWARIQNPGPTSQLAFSVVLQWALTIVSDNDTVPVVGNIVAAKKIQQYV